MPGVRRDNAPSPSLGWIQRARRRSSSVSLHLLIPTLAAIGSSISFSAFSDPATNETASRFRPSPVFTLRSWGTESGLPHNEVRQIEQTPDGYLWMATAHGLVRFDGATFKVFGAEQGLRSTDLYCLFVDSKGWLWIGSHETFQRLANGRFTTLPVPPRQSCITSDGTGRIWVIANNEVYRESANGWERLEGREGIPDKNMQRAMGDRDGQVWLATMDGELHVWREGSCSQTTKVYAWTLMQDSHGHIWTGGSQGQIADIAAGQARRYRLPGDLALYLDVYDLAQTHDGAIWATTYGGRLFRFDGTAWTFDPDLNDLAKQEPRYLFCDRGSSLWIGSRVGGLYRLTRRRLEWSGAPQGLAYEFTRSVGQDNDGTIYVATERGSIYRRTGSGPFEPWADATAARVPADARCVFRAADGQMWFGFYRGVVRRARGGHLLPSPTSAGSLNVGGMNVLCDDGQGGVWTGGTAKGLQRIRSGGESEPPAIMNPSGLAILSVRSEPDGSVWMGGGGVLLCLRDGKVVERFTATNGLPGRGVFALHRDASGALWIGTDAGLGRLQDGQIKVITRQHGLVDDMISQILEDDSGYLWLGSNHGILRIAERDARQVAMGRSSSLHCLQLGHDEGMVSEICTAGSSPSACRLLDGRLCFPTSRGLVTVDPRQFGLSAEDPQQLGASAAPPRVLIEEVQVDGQPGTNAAPPAVLQVPPGNHRIEIHYTGLTPFAPDKVQFRYRLQGVDHDWTSAGTRRVAYYQGLPPGNYVFQVAAVSNDGVWNKAGATLPLILEPFLWQTDWFRFLAVLGLIVGSSLTARRVTQTKLQRRIERLEQQRELEAERARLASVLEGTSDFVAFADPKGYVLYVNPAGRRMLGMGDADDINGSRTASYHPRWATELIQNEGLPSASREGIWSGETALLHRDGHEIPVSQVIVAHKDAAGTLNFLSTIARDITERKRIQADLERRVEERTAELTATNKELEAFAFTVSHDLRAPLRNMAGFIQLLRERSKLVLDEVSIRYGKIVENEAQRLSSLIDELLAFCRLGRTELRRSEVSLEHLISETRDELQVEARDRKITWTVGPLPLVQADRTLLRQVLANLMSNAIKYTRKKDQAQIQIGCHPTDQDSKEWVFFVRDNGAGFDMKYAAKLFGVFQRLHSVSEFEGTGVGLANVQRIIERHGGRVWAEAEENKGATFYFTLPK